uniref:Uncharacterized protein n=1 Tax=Siphoviridae sp. ctbbV81 TaxID=2827900 RepID=A0A8S5TQL9_9CAUD|nr:MAG TPA: hypothetical protein [Siphoviridae sp. ctbbV81]
MIQYNILLSMIQYEKTSFAIFLMFCIIFTLAL